MVKSNTIDFREFERLLRRHGFVQVRTRGSHRSWKHPLVAEVLTIQPKGKEAQPYRVRRFLAMVRDYNLQPDER